MENTNPVFRSLAVIEENILEKLTVERIAGSIHVSKYHYQRLFREMIGESVMRYVTRRRILLAAADLAGTEASILDIALKYGYESHEGFTRSFRAYMGVSPKDYRKYHFSICSLKMQKERKIMLYSKTTDEMIRNLNNLIVQIKEAAAYTRKSRETDPNTADLYAEFWDTASANADAMAEELSALLKRITGILQRPDGISARFLIVKAMEDAAFRSNILAFQTRLLSARAKPEHRPALEPVCQQYIGLARNAQVKSGEIAGLFNELSSLIFKDMRDTAAQKLRAAAEKGNAAAQALEPGLGYIAEELRALAEEISSLALEDVRVSALEDDLFRLDIAASAANMELLRDPSRKLQLEPIRAFREQLEETLQFFGNLSEDLAQGLASQGKEPVLERSDEKLYNDRVFQSRILLFYLKGEVQRLEPQLDAEQKAALEGVCTRMETLLQAGGQTEESPLRRLVGTLQRVQERLQAEAAKMGDDGNPLQFLAGEIQLLAGHAAMNS